MTTDELRSLQAPIKQLYRDRPAAARQFLHARGEIDPGTLCCRVPTPAGAVNAGLHPSAGGDGTAACSGDMLLQALVACAGVTLSAVATSMGIALEKAVIEATGEMDFRGTLGVDRGTPVGLTRVELDFQLVGNLDEPTAKKLIELTERYCVIYQTLRHPPQIGSRLVGDPPALT